MGLPSAPNGLYADGILSVLLTKFTDNWEAERDFNSPHQNFVLLILRMCFSICMCICPSTINLCSFSAARQLVFSINSSAGSLGTLAPFDWGDIEAKDLAVPPSGARNLSSVIDSNVSSLFADGEKPFRSVHECNARSRCPDELPRIGARRGDLSSQARTALP